MYDDENYAVNVHMYAICPINNVLHVLSMFDVVAVGVWTHRASFTFCDNGSASSSLDRPSLYRFVFGGSAGGSANTHIQYLLQ